MLYITYQDYKNMGGDTLPENEAEKYLKKASIAIDSLTFNRIHQIGFENLSENQSNIIKNSCLQISEFYFENEDLLNTVLKKYSLNGVSVELDTGVNVRKINGVIISDFIHSYLSQTGLCTLCFDWR